MALNIELKSIDFILQQPKLFRYKLLVDLRQTLRRIADQKSVEAPYILIGSRRAIYLRNDLTIDNRDQLNRFGWHTSWSNRCPQEGWPAGDLQMEIYVRETLFTVFSVGGPTTNSTAYVVDE